MWSHSMECISKGPCRSIVSIVKVQSTFQESAHYTCRIRSLSSLGTNGYRSSYGIVVKSPVLRVKEGHPSCCCLAVPDLSHQVLLLSQRQPGLVAGALANTVAYILGAKILLRGLTWSGYGSSWFLGSLIYSAFGVWGYSIVCLYFILGSLVSGLCFNSEVVYVLVYLCVLVVANLWKSK